jgi:hypothetical protein
MTDLAQRVALSVGELQPPFEPGLEDAIFGGQIFVSRRRLGFRFGFQLCLGFSQLGQSRLLVGHPVRHLVPALVRPERLVLGCVRRLRRVEPARDLGLQLGLYQRTGIHIVKKALSWPANGL